MLHVSRVVEGNFIKELFKYRQREGNLKTDIAVLTVSSKGKGEQTFPGPKEAVFTMRALTFGRRRELTCSTWQGDSQH